MEESKDKDAKNKRIEDLENQKEQRKRINITIGNHLTSRWWTRNMQRFYRIVGGQGIFNELYQEQSKYR